MDIHLPSWSIPFTKPARYKCAYGGRGSSKTWTFSRLIVSRAYAKRMRIGCLRSVQNSIKESSKQAIDQAIHDMGLTGFFDIHKYSITGRNGSEFFFKGTENNREEIRGWHNVDLIWYEEAQLMSEETWRILIPTIRGNDAELWFSWNPRDYGDYVWRRFLDDPRPDDVIQKVNWSDNPWFPEVLNEERLFDKEGDERLYNMIWEGVPMDEADELKILPYTLLMRCVDAHKQGLAPSAGFFEKHVGLDISDGGLDQNAACFRRGPVIEHIEQWRSETQGDLRPTAMRADGLAREREANALFYDATGVGSPIRGEFARLPGQRGYAVRAIKFSLQVAGPKTMYTSRVTNEQHFMGRNAQMAFALRLRANKTERLMNGDKSVDPMQCLFINHKIPRLNQYLTQLSTPIWEVNLKNGKVQLLKKGDGTISPDMFDATSLAFAKDSSNGLHAR